MCTLIAKESATRLVVLEGLPCCLSVEDVTPAIPKVRRENGWFELFVGAIGRAVPAWAAWLEGESKEKAIHDQVPRCRGKAVRFFDVSKRWQASVPKRQMHRGQLSRAIH